MTYPTPNIKFVKYENRVTMFVGGVPAMGVSEITIRQPVGRNGSAEVTLKIVSKFYELETAPARQPEEENIMNTAVATAKPQGQSLINVMAAKYNMEPQAYAAAVKKTAMPGNATTEEFAAFMMVAREYNLNPLLKEIHAFPKKGGGIVPVVSIDGWVSLINQNPMLNGFEFEMHYSDKAELIACTCRMYRKDREFPTIVTEYMAECYRATDAWKMKHRMLRHKALIQCARYCFGFSGIMDEDEAAKIAEMRDVTPVPFERPQLSEFVNPATKPAQASEPEAEQQPAETQEKPDTGDGPTTSEGSVPDAYEEGRKARSIGTPLKALPTALRDEAHEAEASAWQGGWRERHAEMAKAKGQAG